MRRNLQQVFIQFSIATWFFQTLFELVVNNCSHLDFFMSPCKLCMAFCVIVPVGYTSQELELKLGYSIFYS